ncbi:MAG: alpha/beta hydrolase [Hymenobacteraceae bacterium]|nr:alpha/beta hydrolase [Hymenobacteraceae bacterium]
MLRCYAIATMLLVVVLMMPESPATAQTAKPPAQVMTGRLDHLEAFSSKHVSARNVDVWLPMGYPAPGVRYQVLYMHDGQNLYDPRTASYGTCWGVDTTLSALLRDGTVAPTIVVGVWSSERRFQEYCPKWPYRALLPEVCAALTLERPGAPLSDEYLRFLVTEIKPYIDAHYATAPDRAHTWVAGSSMGGLISLYAALEYPRVFAGAACLSTHWPLSLARDSPAFTTAMLDYLAQKLPRRHRPRLYFDFGTATLDARYPPHQARIDAFLRTRKYLLTRRLTRRFEGAEHNEAAWARRLNIPLTFLLGRTARVRRTAAALEPAR